MSDPGKAAVASAARERADFIREAIFEDLEAGRYSTVHTRFPPEPNGYPHIGHAKAIWINFSIAAEFGGVCNLRFDDTNPVREEQEYIDAIMEDIRWLGYDWGERLFFASDYFDQLYEWALQLIRDGLAYVDELGQDQIREYRGTLTEAGRNSPWRDRPVAENLTMFERMKRGDYPEGACVLRAKIDMASPNINLRDPVLYRILHAEHPRTGDRWCIYPMYDFAHGQSDSIEGITHSLCSLEYEDHRPLYDWLLEALGIYRPRQIEFARLNLDHTLVQKRKLRRLVEQGHLKGWDDPRMPTLRGMRRRGYAPEAIREFCAATGIGKRNNLIEIEMLEHYQRQYLNRHSPRVMAVLDPLRVVIENYPEGQVEWMTAVNNPEDETAGTREVPFSREIYIEREDFMLDPPRKFYRLAPGREVRLRSAWLLTCRDVVYDAQGEIRELRCTIDPDSRGGNAPDGRRVRSTLHWVSAAQALPAEVRLYDKLFSVRNPNEASDGLDPAAQLNPDSLQVLTQALVEPSLGQAEAGMRYQFERIGYFAVDPDSRPGQLVFNRSVTLRDQWARLQRRRQR
ncbi:MAG: glutamine--tRNA ligase/YqeY domain fusion protein [Anaerolineaceae bacterium]|nr:glutamine--tRNA ligase/YqeY domain fusion protein [Anaerolineaceae bacterium]